MAGVLWLWAGDGGVAPGGTTILSQLPLAGKAGWPGSNDAVLVWRDAQLPACWTPSETTGSGLPWVLNTNACEIGSLSKETISKRLNRSGIRTQQEQQREGRHFLVTVFHLEVVRIHRLNASFRSHAWLQKSVVPPSWHAELTDRRDDKTDNYAEEARTGEALLKHKLGRIAVRTVYALGLDAAYVELAIDDDGHIEFVNLQLPGSKCGSVSVSAEDAVAMEEAAAAFAKSLEISESSASPILIGADPEFILLKSDGRVASAAQLGGLGSRLGSDMILSRQRIVHPVAELRPEPASRPEELFRNVRRLLAQANSRLRSEPLRMLAGAMPVPGLAIGGHVHLSRVPLTSRLLRALDSYAAFPLALAEDPRGQGRRPRFGYLGDFRRQPHGGFEYRTLPSWLVSPKITLGVFALSLLVAEDLASLSYFPSMDDDYVDAYYAGDRDRLKGCFAELRQSVESAPSYTRYERWIKPLLDALHKGESWDESKDIRDKWQLR